MIAPLTASGARCLASAVWIWWLALGAWEIIPRYALAAVLAAMLAAALHLGRDKPFWSARPEEKPLVAAALLLVVNAFGFRHFHGSPRLSFLTAAPLVWTAACILGEWRLSPFPSRGPERPTDAPRPATGFLSGRGRISAVAAFLLIFNGWFSLGGLLRYHAMNTDYWDMGSISQSMWNLAHGHGYRLSTAEGILSNRFGLHCEPLFFLLSPLMSGSRGPEAMIILQTLCVSVAALFTGLAMERALRHPGGFWLGLAGLGLHPAVGYPLWSDYHGDIFALLPLSIMLWALTAARWRVFWTAFAASAACKEYALVATFGIGLLLLFLGRGSGGEGRDIRLQFRACVLLFLSVAVYLAVEFWFMPFFRPAGVPSVFAIYTAAPAGQAQAWLPALGERLETMFGSRNLGNLFHTLLPLSPWLFLTPLAWLGAFPNLAKDMVFGMNLAHHHIAPAIPILMVGLALGLARAHPQRPPRGALIQMGLCLLLSAVVWSPAPVGRPGWSHMERTWRGFRESGPKARLLVTGSDPSSAKLITAGLGGYLYNSPELYFLGTPAGELDRCPRPREAETVVDLWDQGFQNWTFLDSAHGQLLRYRDRWGEGSWSETAPGVLSNRAARRPGARPLRLLAGPGAGPREIPATGWLGDARLDSGWAYAVFLVPAQGQGLPMALKTPGRPWFFFPLSLGEKWDRGARLRLAGQAYVHTGMPAGKRWRIIREAALPLAPLANGVAGKEFPQPIPGQSLPGDQGGGVKPFEADGNAENR